MATFRKITVKNCGDNVFSKSMDFTCKSCGYKWVSSSGATCPKCNGVYLEIKSQDSEKR